MINDLTDSFTKLFDLFKKYLYIKKEKSCLTHLFF